MKTYLAIKMTLLGCLQLVSPASVALGNDWLPDNADQVLLELPRNYSRYSEGLSLGERSGQQSDQKVAELIRYYLDIARDTGDERYLGYAHTLVAGRDSAEIDSEALILAYAALLQRGHR
ncbi:MAG: hypothetical protein KTR17_03060, partial [Cellvibrionaceae bacterium]|nr:hypothetical protein [Cellvibrionaceae bacterium]